MDVRGGKSRREMIPPLCAVGPLNYAAVSGGGGESRKGEREERKERTKRKEGSADCELSPLAKAM